jgi:hypothetical protein
VYKFKKEALQPLIDKVTAGLPTWKAGLMTQAGRAILVKAKMSAVPVHTAIATTISPWVIRMIDKRRRAFLWKGTAVVSGDQCKLAWPRVCRPTELGGLGFPNLELMGYALRLRWLWLRRTDAAKPWTSLSDGVEKPVHEMFHYSTMIHVGNGTSTLFWTDRWLNGQSKEELAPCLISTVGPIIRRKRTVVDALQDNKWVTDIRGGLTVQVLLDFLSIWDRVQEVNLTDSLDRVIWRWSRDGAFSTASAYRVFFSGQHCHTGSSFAPQNSCSQKMQVLYLASFTRSGLDLGKTKETQYAG